MEEYTNVTIACMKCKKKVAIKEMKYSRTGEDLICVECSNAEKGVKLAVSGSSGLLRPLPASASSKPAVKEEPSQKISYECGKCGYKFSRNKGISVNTCPYCNGGPLSKSESFGFYNL